MASINIQTRIKTVAGPLVGIAIVSYFGFHAVEGERGLRAWWQLTQRVAEAEASHAQVTAQRTELEHRVSLLRPESLDPDMLEERARVMLNYGRADEILIFERAVAADGAVPKK